MMSNLSFALLATTHTPTLLGLGLVNGLDNFAQASQGTALITFLSGLTSPQLHRDPIRFVFFALRATGKDTRGNVGFRGRAHRLSGVLCLYRLLEPAGVVLVVFRDTPGVAGRRAPVPVATTEIRARRARRCPPRLTSMSSGSYAGCRISMSMERVHSPWARVTGR